MGGRLSGEECLTPAEDRLTPASLSCIKIYVVNLGRVVHFPRKAILLDHPTIVRSSYVLPLFFLTTIRRPICAQHSWRIDKHSQYAWVNISMCFFPYSEKGKYFPDYIGVSSAKFRLILPPAKRSGICFWLNICLSVCRSVCL